jgi:ABC-type lipoprotein export system ATPase subunit
MIKIDNVSRLYPGETPVRALDEVNLTFPEKGMIFIIGKSGSGKSTMLNILAGFDKPTMGDIVFNDRKLNELSYIELDYYRNSTIGFVFQDYCLVESFTAYQNIRMSYDYQNKRITKKEMDKILASVGMEGYGKRLPKQLSAGQKQRIAIARALAKNPKVLLADEPTGNLDSKTTVQILDLLKEISKERLVIIVSHNKNDAIKYGDRIIELSNGKVKSDKYRNENFDNSYKSSDNEITLPAKGRLTEEQINEINDKIKSNNGAIKLSRELDEFLDYPNLDDSNEEYESVKTKMGWFNVLKYSWLFFKNHLLSFALVIMIVTCLIVTLSISIQFANYDGNLQYQEIVEDKEFKSMIIRDKSLEEIEDNNLGDSLIELTDERKEELLSNYNINSYDIYAYEMPITQQGLYYKKAEFGKGNVLSVNNLVVCDDNLINLLFADESGNVKLLAGEIKADGDGIIISDYVADLLILAFRFYGMPNYESIIKDETHLTKYWGVKIDAIIDTNYKEVHKAALDKVKEGVIDEVDEDFTNFYEDVCVRLSHAYTINPNYYESYLKLYKSLTYNGQNIKAYKHDLKSADKNVEKKDIALYFNSDIKDDEIILDANIYNQLFDTNCTAADKTEFEESVQDFMKNNDSWIIDGNYRRIAPSRFTESDQLIFLNYNRITCLINAIKRYKKYKGKSRPDIAKGCEEKIDKEFFLWLIWKGRTKERQNRLLNQAKNHKNGIVFKNRKELFKYYKSNNIPYNK